MDDIPVPVPPMIAETLFNFRGYPQEGSIIGDRYDVQDCLGLGSTGAVLRALDRSSGVLVAVKIAGEASKRQDEQIMNEAQIYRRIVTKPSRAVNLFPRMFDVGKHNDLRYLVFDLGGFNLFDVLTLTCLHPLPKRHLREIGVQLLRGIHFLQGLSIVHTDLKPSNIVLRSSQLVHTRRMRADEFFVSKVELKSTELYIVDFGDGVILEHHGIGVVGTSSYRAPEITLGLPWTSAIDVFSAGCVLAELYLGRPLFHYAETDIERLALLERVLGPFPESLVRRAEHVHAGRFSLEHPIRVQFPVPNVECKGEVKRVMAAWPLSAVMFDVRYLELCKALMALDPTAREDIRATLSLTFFDACDADVVLAEPWECRGGSV